LVPTTLTGHDARLTVYNFLKRPYAAGVMWDTYWNATSQQNYTKLDSGVQVVVSQHFESQGQLAGILVRPSTPQGGVISQGRN